MIQLILCGVLVSIFAGLYRYSVDYGYRGRDRADARNDAILTTVLVALVVVVCIVWKWASST